MKTTLMIKKPLEKIFNSCEKPRKDRFKSAKILDVNRKIKKSIIDGDANVIEDLKFSKRPKSRDFNSNQNRILIKDLHCYQSNDSRCSDAKMYKSNKIISYKNILYIIFIK